jgi:hypothetical protein
LERKVGYKTLIAPKLIPINTLPNSTALRAKPKAPFSTIERDKPHQLQLQTNFGRIL